MKNFTFLMFFLLVTFMVTAQQIDIREPKFQKLQDYYARISKLVSYHQKNRIAQDQEFNVGLKNALALHALDSIVDKAYDSEADEWINESKIHYLYEEDLKNTSEMMLKWNNTTGAWEESSRMEFSYGANGLISEILTYETEESSGEIVLQHRSTAHYNNENRLDSTLQYYTEDQTTWNDAGKIEYLYNEAGRLDQMNATTMIEEEGEVIIATLQIEFTYDNEERLDTYVMKIITSEFELPMLQANFFYDESGTRSASETSAYNLLTSAMEKVERNEYDYNESDDLVVQSLYTWDEAGEDWVLDMKDEYAYTDLLYSDVTFPSYGLFLGEFDEAISTQLAIDEVTSYTIENDTWEQSKRSIYYYTEGTSTNVEHIADLPIMVYPNPVTDRIIMSWNGQKQLSLEIYSINGLKIMDRIIMPGIEISASHLNTGVYLYKLMDNNKLIQTGKLIKK